MTHSIEEIKKSNEKIKQKMKNAQENNYKKHRMKLDKSENRQFNNK